MSMEHEFDFSGRKVLVTGGAGFIGSHLVDRLLACGAEVVVLDNFSTGFRENLAGASRNPRFSLVEGDIRSVDDCRRAVDGADFVFHEAALGSVPRSIATPEESVAVNVSGFVNVLHAAAVAGAGRFVYASSSSVYGDGDAFPQKEGCEGFPMSPYAATKRADELFAENFHRVYGIDTVGLRYFNVFGPRQNPDGPYAAVVPRFVDALKRHEPPVIYGDGSQSRDFTYVANVVEANLLAMVSDGPDALNRVYNIGCGRTTSVSELFRLIRDVMGRRDAAVARLEPRHEPGRNGDLKASLADIGDSASLLGYRPAVDVAEGVGMLLDGRGRPAAG